jgi:hypothetical protein
MSEGEGEHPSDVLKRWIGNRKEADEHEKELAEIRARMRADEAVLTAIFPSGTDKILRDGPYVDYVYRVRNVYGNFSVEREDVAPFCYLDWPAPPAPVVDGESAPNFSFLADDPASIPVLPGRSGSHPAGCDCPACKAGRDEAAAEAIERLAAKHEGVALEMERARQIASIAERGM